MLLTDSRGDLVAWLLGALVGSHQGTKACLSKDGTGGIYVLVPTNGKEYLDGYKREEERSSIRVPSAGAF